MDERLQKAEVTEGVLRDGAAVLIRPAGPQDEGPILRFLQGLSPDSLATRFFNAVNENFLRGQSEKLANMEPEEGGSLVATAGGDDAVVGHASYHVTGPAEAEVAFLVAERWQNRGLGTLLVGEVAAAASLNGIQQLRAIVLSANHRMIQVFRDSGFDIRVRPEPGQLVVEFPADPTPGARERYEEREWAAVSAAVEGFFRPKAVALVGASRRRGTIGGDLFYNMVSYGFTGPVIPVNPSTSSVQGVLAYPSVADIPVPVDLAVIAVPATAVPAVVEQCEAKGIRRLVVISAGFSEVGGEGVKRQEELISLCRAGSIRLIGPNCMGIVNTEEDVRLSATFAPTPPRPGGLAFMSQSGALGLAIMDYSSRLGLGLGTFVSVGNKADISGNDLIRYWARDPDVDVILLYLESFGNPRKFSRIARRVSRDKPIVAVKSGRSPAGARATGSHTGALISASDTTVDALFRHAGVIRTDTLEEMFDVASLLAHQPAPRGRRVAIMTNAGGPAILCADACVAEGLQVPSLSAATKSALREILPKEASAENPVDMVASASAQNYRRVVEVLAKEPGVDALIVIFVPPLSTGADDVARAIAESAGMVKEEGKTLLTVFMQSRGFPEGLTDPDQMQVPSFSFPESAAIALARTARYGEWRARPESPPVRFDDLKIEQAAAVVAEALEHGDTWLSPRDVATVLDCYGIPMVEQRWCLTPQDVGEAAGEMGGTLVLKASATGVVHKTDAGAVALGVAAGQAGAAAAGMLERLKEAGHEVEGFLVQRMAPKGLEMIVGAVQDAHFGPVLACGAGGTMVELLGDVSVRIVPLSRDEAHEMVQDLNILPALTGYRGSPPLDVDALIDVILRTGTLADRLLEIQELDLNPVLLHEEGVSLVDARIRVARNNGG